MLLAVEMDAEIGATVLKKRVLNVDTVDRSSRVS
jgi:hypothetical protein